MSDEEDECGTGAGWPEITEEELSYAQDLWNREPFPDRERLDNWIRVMEEVVGTIGYTYCLTFQLFERNNLNHKSLLDALRALYIHAMAEVNVVKRMESVNVDKPSYIP